MEHNLSDSIGDGLLILGQVGSKAYGTSTPESDDDYMGVVCAPLSCYMGLDKWANDGSMEIKRAQGAEVDAVVYDIRKFFKLCLAFNPHVIPLLYLRDEDYRYLHPVGKRIISCRHIFESKRALNTFVGYARGQISNVQRGITGKYGEKRKKLIEEFGYDVKFAYHTIRLLGMIQEFFEIGEMTFHRGSDVEFLMEIRRGEVAQGEFFQIADALMDQVTFAFNKATWLPDEPDYKKANELCVTCIKAIRL